MLWVLMSLEWMLELLVCRCREASWVAKLRLMKFGCGAAITAKELRLPQITRFLAASNNKIRGKAAAWHVLSFTIERRFPALSILV